MDNEMVVEETKLQGTEAISAPKFFNKFGIIYVIGSVFSFGIQFGAKFLFNWINPNLLDTMDKKIIGLILPVYVIAYPLFLLLITRLPKGVKVEDHKMSFKMLLLSFCMAYSLMFVSNLLGTILSIPKELINIKSKINPLADLVIDSSPLVQLFVMVILAPIFEELIFRKFLIDRVNRFGEGTAIFVSALMFSLFHGNISQVIYAFVLGLFFGYIYIRTGRVRYTMILHFLINFMGSIASGGVLKLLDMSSLSDILVKGDLQLIMEYIASHRAGLVIYVLYNLILQFIIWGGLILLLIKKDEFKLKRIGTPIPKGQRFKTIMLNPGMIMFTVAWVGMIVYSYIVE